LIAACVQLSPRLVQQEDRIYRRSNIGAKLLDRENLAAELSGRNYWGKKSAKSSAAT
jgi:hypothetical protein